MKKKTHVIVYLISTIITFVLGLGVAYSYLAVRFKGVETESTINIGMGTMTITYQNNSGELRLEKAIPGASVSKEFTLVGKNDTVGNDNASNEMYYKIGIAVDNNTFTRGVLEYKLEPLESSINGQMQEETTGTVPGGGTKYIGSGYFEGNIEGEEHKYKITLTFPETGEDQSEEMGKEIGLHITIDQGTKIIDVSNNYQANSLVAEILNKTTEEKEADGLKEDDFGNLRYVGATPNNYITFNNETWRIIGLFDIEDQVGPTTVKKGKGIKIIRNESLGEYSWDSSDVNNWTTASLQKYLNGEYYNSLRTLSKSQIANVTWHLGGWETSEVSAKNMYKYERGIGANNIIGEEYHVYTGDNIGRATTWQGKIALMYPSDYGYASTDTTCREDIGAIYFTSYKNGYCSNSNWLRRYQWTLSPYSSFSNTVFFVEYEVTSKSTKYSSQRDAVPSLFLSPDILKVSGDGTSEHPYTIE